MDLKKGKNIFKVILCIKSLRLPFYYCLVTLIFFLLIPVIHRETLLWLSRGPRWILIRSVLWVQETKGEEYFSAFWRKASCRAIKTKTKKLNRHVPVFWSVERVEMLISCRSSNVSVWKRRMEEPSENAIHTPPPAHAMCATLTSGSGWTSNFCQTNS